MNNITLFVVGACVSISLSWLLVHLLRSSLADLLAELWSSRARAGFWAAMAGVTILLLGVFSGTGTSGYSHDGTFELETGFFSMVGQLRWTLFGLFCASMAVSLAVVVFMGRADRAVMEKRFDEPIQTGGGSLPKS